MSAGTRLLPVADHSRKDFLYSCVARGWCGLRPRLDPAGTGRRALDPGSPGRDRGPAAAESGSPRDGGDLHHEPRRDRQAGADLPVVEFRIVSRQDGRLAGNASDGLASYMLNGSLATPPNIWFTGGILQTGEGTALNNAGITQSAILIEQPTPVGDWAPTFWPYSNSRATPLTASNFTKVADGAPVAVINASGMSQLGLPANNDERYVIFGLNIPCTLFRNLAQEPPYHNPDHPDEDPAIYYKCFGVVFLVSYTTPATVTGGPAVPSSSIPGFAAKFMGPVGFDHDGPVTASAAPLGVVPASTRRSGQSIVEGKTT